MHRYVAWKQRLIYRFKACLREVGGGGGGLGYLVGEVTRLSI